MAEPYEKNDEWYVRYRDARGAWRDKATTARTKTEARRLQLELELEPWIRRAVERSPSEVLFPREDGEPHAPEVQLQDVLRRALARAA